MKKPENFFRAPPGWLLAALGLYAGIGIIFAVIGVLAHLVCLFAGMPPFGAGPCAALPFMASVSVAIEGVFVSLIRIAAWPYVLAGEGPLQAILAPWLEDMQALARAHAQEPPTPFGLVVGLALAVAGLVWGRRCLRCMIDTAKNAAGFFKTALDHPDEAYDMFMSTPCWKVFHDKPADGFGAHLPPGHEWDGPFDHKVPKLGGRVVWVFGRVPDYEQSQQDFTLKYKDKT